jgi:Tfp pilus assembly protein PilF
LNCRDRSAWGLVGLSAHLTVCACIGLASLTSAPAADLGGPAAPFRTPYIPAADSEILQEVPSIADPAVAEMRVLRTALDASRNSLTAAIHLAHAYIDYGRQIGDAHYAGYAEAVIDPWVQAPVPPAAALVTQATILQYRHQFNEARDLLQRSVQVNPRDAQAWLTLATLEMVQGNYRKAALNCAQVASNADVQTGLTCFAGLRSYTGRARESLAMLQQVATAAEGGSPAYKAWVEGLMAESAERLGDWTLAETHYRNALKLQPRDNFLLVAYADYLLDRARPQEVVPLLAEHAQSDTAFLRLALAQEALHSDQVQRYVWIMAARFEALRLRGSEYFGREESRFALQLQHDPQTALDMGLRNWQMQREPWDARVVLEAALAAKRPQAAAPVLDFLQTTRLEDPLIEPLVRELKAQLTASAGAGR